MSCPDPSGCEQKRRDPPEGTSRGGRLSPVRGVCPDCEQRRRASPRQPSDGGRSGGVIKQPPHPTPGPRRTEQGRRRSSDWYDQREGPVNTAKSGENRHILDNRPDTKLNHGDHINNIYIDSPSGNIELDPDPFGDRAPGRRGRGGYRRRSSGDGPRGVFRTGNTYVEVRPSRRRRRGQSQEMMCCVQ